MLLGGDDEQLMKSGRPVEVMMKHLNISTSQNQSLIGSSNMTPKMEGNR